MTDLDGWPERERKLKKLELEGSYEHDRLTKDIEKHAGDEWGREHRKKK